MRILLRQLFLLLCLPGIVSAQIISPDTVCVGQAVTFNADLDFKHIQYCWEFGTSSMTPVLTTSQPVPGTATNGQQFAVVAQATMVFDTANGEFYGFVTCASNAFVAPSVQRLNFGPNPHGTPTATDLGNPNSAFVLNSALANSNMEAIELVKDDFGIFHAFISNGGIVHWIFGNGINQPPTSARRIYTNRPTLGMPMQISIMHYNGEWLLFAGQSYGASPILLYVRKRH